MCVSNNYTSTCYKAIYSISSFYRPIVYTNNYIIQVLITQAHRCRQINTTIVYIFIFFLFKIFFPLCVKVDHTTNNYLLQPTEKDEVYV